MGAFSKTILFGKELFDFKKFKKPAEPGTLYNFAQHGIVRQDHNSNSFQSNEPQPIAYILTKEDMDKKVAIEAAKLRKSKKPIKKVKKIDRPIEVHFTPKGIFEMKVLNDNEFYIKTDPAYIEEQVAELQDKLDFIGKKPKDKKSRNQDMVQQFEVGGVRYAREELESMVERLRNRTKITDVADILEKYPHTTTELIMNVLGLDKQLLCNKADEFVPDFPKVAIDAMKEYNDMCIKVCGKKTFFYVIADRKDFEVKNKRRDPILLAQSPFGFFWNILGAWDEKHMIYLGDL